ncbi:VOC family protein [Fundidesulfovibrio soli]|uniref:VOC family protein n=1 Tax=Fundidesulfovibrio soli TaxID=2922716 RepID=UPI001FAF1D5B|nr:VOC family protein [Fundidesulfovibrio soli]
MRIEPYLFFEGRCDEALAFYAEAVGAQVTMLMRYSDSPEPPAPGMIPAGSEDKVMHANVRVGDTTFMASDGNCRGEPDFRGFSLSLTAADEAEAKRAFIALAEGGQVLMPLGKTFFSPCFGMLTDRFGVGWMVIVPA